MTGHENRVEGKAVEGGAAGGRPPRVEIGPLRGQQPRTHPGLIVGRGPRVGGKAEGTLASPDLALPTLEPKRLAQLARRAGEEFDGTQGLQRAR